MVDISRKKHKDCAKLHNFKVNIQGLMHRWKINSLSGLIGWKYDLDMCKGD